MSGALAAVDPASRAGVHCCGPGDWSAILAAGPGILWLPVRSGIESIAGYLAQFLDDGGWVAWGAVPTDGPVGTTADRHWRELADLWCSLVQGGCDAVRLRRQAIVTPACGLGLHELSAVDHVFELVDAVADRVHGQAVATRPVDRRLVCVAASAALRLAPTRLRLDHRCSLDTAPHCGATHTSV